MTSEDRIALISRIELMQIIFDLCQSRPLLEILAEHPTLLCADIRKISRDNFDLVLDGGDARSLGPAEFRKFKIHVAADAPRRWPFMRGGLC